MISINNLVREQVFARPVFKRLISPIWSIPIVVILIVGVFLVRVSYDTYNQAQKAEYRLLDAHARYADLQVDKALDNVDHLLVTIDEQRSAHFALRGKTMDAAVLASHQHSLPEIGAVLITDATGKVLSATHPALTGRNVSGQAFFQAHLDRARLPGLFISRPEATLLGTNAIMLSRPFFDEGHHFAGIIAATVDYRFFAEALRSINPEESASVTVVVNQYGDLVYRLYEPEKFFGKNIAQVSTVFQEHKQAKIPVTRHLAPSAHDGKMRLFLMRDVSDSGLSLILSRQQDKVLAEWWRNLFFRVLVFLMAVVVTLFLARIAQRGQDEVSAAAKKYQILTEGVNDVIWTMDAQTLHFLYVSPSIYRLTGFTPEELLARGIEQILNPKSAIRSMHLLDRRKQDFLSAVAAPDKVYVDEECLPRKDGSFVWTEVVSTYYLNETTGAVEMRGVTRDISERKKAQEEQGRFVAMVSHEFRTPLVTIDGAIQMLEMDGLEVDEATRKRYRKIQMAVDRLTALLDDYLNQDRLDTVTHGLHPLPIAPLLLLQDCQSSAQAVSIEHKVVVEGANVPNLVWCDGDMMRLALRVLVDNAVIYTPAGSVVRLQCRSAPGGGIEFVVSDNGSGIPEDELPHIFEKFFRGRRAFEHSGTGLGLYLAASVAEAHGGTLSARNLPQCGAEFTLWLPDVRHDGGA